LTAPTPEPPHEPERDAALTIHIRREHVWALAILLVSLAAGFAIGRVSAPDSQTVLYGVPPSGGASTSGAQTPGAAASSAPVKVATAGRPARGPEDAKVTVVEFVDYECPFCGRFARDTLPQIEREYGSRIRYVSRHFPLPSHSNAMRSAIAAECADRLGRFWEYHEHLFQHQDQLDDRGLARMARQVGMDGGAFRSCTRSKEAKAAVEKDAADGRKYGVTGTPAFFINGAPLTGAQPFEAFKAAIDAELKKG
jgi:protein-disulfide isomerase